MVPEAHAPESDPPAAPLAPGSLLAPGVEVIEHLSRGLELDVYDVWQERRSCRCVAKTAVPGAPGSTARRLIREGHHLERLAHPHLVRAYETLDSPLGPVVILETLEGETLSRTIERRQRRRLPELDLVWLGLHLCSVLQYLHTEGLLHLDLKPSNIINRFGRATLIDLSLARPPGPAPAGLGTPVYLAPEQARGDELGPPADVWGVGAVLFTAATGQRPFAFRGGESYEQLDRRAVPVRSHRRLTSGLAGAIDACLEPAPASRPGLNTLTQWLEALLPEIPGGEPAPS